MVELERISGWKPILLNLLENGQPLATACANIRVPMTRVFNEQTLDPKFKEQCARALRVGRGEEDRSGGRGETARVGADVKGGRIIVGGRF